MSPHLLPHVYSQAEEAAQRAESLREISVTEVTGQAADRILQQSFGLPPVFEKVVKQTGPVPNAWRLA